MGGEVGQQRGTGGRGRGECQKLLASVIVSMFGVGGKRACHVSATRRGQTHFDGLTAFNTIVTIDCCLLSSKVFANHGERDISPDVHTRYHQCSSRMGHIRQSRTAEKSDTRFRRRRLLRLSPTSHRDQS